MLSLRLCKCRGAAASAIATPDAIALAREGGIDAAMQIQLPQRLVVPRGEIAEAIGAARRTTNRNIRWRKRPAFPTYGPHSPRGDSGRGRADRHCFRSCGGRDEGDAGRLPPGRRPRRRRPRSRRDRFGYKLAQAIASGAASKGVALCGSGIGISISVNRHPACRCALVSEPLSARLAREHNDANVIALGARLVGAEMATACVETFLATPFGGGRHQRRVDKLSHPPFAREPA